MSEFVQSFAIELGAVVLSASLLAWAIFSIWRERKLAQADKQTIETLRSKRFAKYAKAQEAYQSFREKLEKKNNGNTVIIDLIHDLGDDFVGRDKAEQQITFDEAFEAVAAIRGATPRTRILVVLHTLGGYARPAHMIALALKQHLKKAKRHNPKSDPMVIAYVPYVAMSGGTMIALSADRITMDPTAALGPIDTIYGGFPSEAYEDLIERKGVEATQDVLVMLAHEAKKYDKYAAKVARQIINKAHKLPGDDPNRLANYLTSGQLSHSESISPERADELGINVSTRIPDEIYGLVDARIRMIQTKIEEEERKGDGGSGSDHSDPEKPEAALETMIARKLRVSPRL